MKARVAIAIQRDAIQREASELGVFNLIGYINLDSLDVERFTDPNDIYDSLTYIGKQKVYSICGIPDNAEHEYFDNGTRCIVSIVDDIIDKNAQVISDDASSDDELSKLALRKFNSYIQNNNSYIAKFNMQMQQQKFNSAFLGFDNCIDEIGKSAAIFISNAPKATICDFKENIKILKGQLDKNLDSLIEKLNFKNIE